MFAVDNPILVASLVFAVVWFPKALRWLLLRPRAGRAKLLTLPYSHYVELARWALQIKQVPFVELKFPVGPHCFGVGLYRLAFSREYQSTTSYPGDADAKRHATNKEQGNILHRVLVTVFQSIPSSLRRLSGVPALVLADGTLLPDSWSILEHCGFSIDKSFRERMDVVLGPAVRRFCYHQIFRYDRSFYRAIQSSSPLLMACFDVMESLFRLTWAMTAMMDLTAAGSECALHQIELEFAHVESILNKNTFLGSGQGGTSFGGGDLAFSALSGWLLLPPNYTGRVLDGSLLAKERFNAFPGWVQNYQKLNQCFPKACQHVQRCYKELRGV